MSNDNLKRVFPAIAALDPSTARDTKKENSNDKDEKSGKEESGSTANVLIELAVASCEFFLDERGDEYAIVKDKDIQRTLKLRGRLFRRWLAGKFYKTTGRAASKEALSTALLILEAKAGESDPVNCLIVLPWLIR